MPTLSDSTDFALLRAGDPLAEHADFPSSERSCDYALQVSRTKPLKLDSISISFGGVQALSGIDLQVQPGEIRAIIGPNGAGKSSLINVISGIYKPDSGNVWLNGKRYSQVPVGELARLGVARTFQNLALFGALSVFDNVRIAGAAFRKAGLVSQWLGLRASREENRELNARTESILRFLELNSVRDRLVGTLSYGLQKRVEIARALLNKPKLLLLDEPLAGMTAGEKWEIAHFVRAIRGQFGTTVVLIEHDLGIVLSLADQVAVLDYGRKIADGTPAQISQNPAVIDAYIGEAHEDQLREEVAA